MNTTQRARFTAPGGGVTKGLGYLIGSLFVVARHDAAAAAQFTGATAGIWTLVKTSAQAWTQGQKVYWNTGTSKADSDVTTGPLIGVAAAVAANPSSTGRVRLNAASPGTAEGLGLDATEYGRLNGALAGTQVAGKAVIADSNVNTGVSKVTQLHIGATGAEVQVTATPAQLNALAGSIGGLAAAVAAGLGGSDSILKTEAATHTLVAAHATKARACLVVVRVDETYAVGTGTLPTVKVGETDALEAAMAVTVLDTEAAGTVLVFAFTNTATKAIVATSTAKVGDATGGCTVTVIAIPTT
jgi:predicted RecA/RadA family phage recombinase